MSYDICLYDPLNPQLRIRHGNREISFTLAPVAPDSHDWLGQVLDRQITELVDYRVREALESHKKQMRELLGVK